VAAIGFISVNIVILVELLRFIHLASLFMQELPVLPGNSTAAIELPGVCYDDCDRQLFLVFYMIWFYIAVLFTWKSLRSLFSWYALSRVEQKELREKHEREDAELEKKRAELEADKAAGVCGFWFIKADYILGLQGTSALPRFQDLPDEAKEFIKISYVDAYGQQKLVGLHLSVSHRWLEKVQPDKAGEQLRKIKQHLQENRNIKWVFYDYWSMPQRSLQCQEGGDDRKPADKMHFDWMLQNMAMLYLGTSVLLLVDLAYMSRFWPLFEAWLSMQKCTLEGLKPDEQIDAASLTKSARAGNGESSPSWSRTHMSSLRSTKRCTMVRTMNASDHTVDDLKDMWSTKTPEQARDLLGLDDVTVTNEKDKEFCLGKITSMDEIVKTSRAKHSEDTCIPVAMHSEETCSLQVHDE